MKNDFKEDLMKIFEMINLGLINYFIGIELRQQKKEIFISQNKYIETLLKKFKMYDCKFVATPLMTNEKPRKDDEASKVDASQYRSLIGSLLHLTAIRSDIIYASSLLSKFMQWPSQIHYGVAKRILRYLQGTKEFDIWYKTMTNSRLRILSWASKKQATIAQSIAELEYVATTESTSQAIWLGRILEEMGEQQEGPIVIYYDNKSVISLYHRSRGNQGNPIRETKLEAVKEVSEVLPSTSGTL
ncbi:hypothetical protein CR513_01353, partial [Mucuna pruriens]